MLHLQLLEHPYLHELFKAVLLYDDAQKVKDMLAIEIGGKLMKEWELCRKYQEITPTPEKERYRKAVDVIWILKRPEDKTVGLRRVIHEVKTGNCDVGDIVRSYKGLRFCAFENGDGDSWKDECSHDYAGTTNTPIFIWSWKKHQILPEDYETKKLIMRGAVRLLPLDWLLPILKEGMSEIFEWTN